jgi:hypothetical protein
MLHHMPVHELQCPSGSPVCRAAELCDRCLAGAIAARRPQSRVIGACWAESICRGELRARDAWPTRDERTIAIARARSVS